MATEQECNRFKWPNGTLVLATTFDLIRTAPDGEIWVSMPIRSSGEGGLWMLDDERRVVFHRRELSKVQTLALGNFVEHRQHGADEELLVTRPTFDYFGGSANEILGSDGEPVNGVIMLTSDPQTLCPQPLFPNNCPSAAGLSYAVPYSTIKQVGSAVVSNFNTDLWHTLAHETAHTLGLLHDDAPAGFMRDGLPLGYSTDLGITTDPLHPGLDNNERWEDSLMSKGELPRSSGFYHTGCTGVHECAPLGKPGWSCNGVFCEELD